MGDVPSGTDHTSSGTDHGGGNQAPESTNLHLHGNISDIAGHLTRSQSRVLATCHSRRPGTCLFGPIKCPLGCCEGGEIGCRASPVPGFHHLAHRQHHRKGTATDHGKRQRPHARRALIRVIYPAEETVSSARASARA